jgi:hypothetical protein
MSFRVLRRRRLRYFRLAVCRFTFLFHVCVNPGPERRHSGFFRPLVAQSVDKKTIKIRPSRSYT